MTHRLIISHACRLAAAALLLCMAGCVQKPGVLFPPLERPIVWPEPPDPPRIAYVGQVATSADLKPGKSGLEAIGDAIFGRKDIGSMLSPYSVCTDGDDRVFVADGGAQIVHVFDLKTRQYQQWLPPAAEKNGPPRPKFAQLVGIAWDPGGRLLVSDSVASALFVFDAQGRYLGQFGAGELRRPAGICVDPRTRRIFVADVLVHQVAVLDADGKLLQHFGERGAALGEFNFPTNVAVDGKGRVYVSDSLNFRVQQFTPELRPIRQIGSQGDVPGTFSQPKGIAVDSEDHLYVVDSRFENVQIFDPEGRLLLTFGEEGTGRGQFWLPSGIHIDPHNRIWVADPYNRRVQVFDYLHRDKEDNAGPAPPPADDPETSP